MGKEDDLLEAASGGDVSTILKSLKEGANVNCDPDGDVSAVLLSSPSLFPSFFVSFSFPVQFPSVV